MASISFKANVLNVGLPKGEMLGSLQENKLFTKFSCSFALKEVPVFIANDLANDFAHDFTENLTKEMILRSILIRTCRA